MDIKIIEEKKNRIVFEMTGEDHTLANLLRKELWNDEHVKSAAYTIDHPEVGQPKFILETDGADPKKTLQAAAKRLVKELAKVKDEAKKLK
ncbi:DNA-directed RNA polymerase subunit L [Candidatus Woesearchaeota archaeon]|nr:DNA-directed RNA polymerase subunit L [Candidatus Woesearchaeota archaeon]